MALEIDNINLEGSLSATTISATTIVFGGQPIQNVFVQNNASGGFLPISGGTVTGETIFNSGLSANTISGGTFYGNGSNLIGVGNAVSAGLTWKFSTNTSSSDPGSGNFKYNNSSPSGVSEIYIDYITENGIDAKLILEKIKSASQIYVQQRDDSSKAALFNVTADTVDNNGWFTIPVSTFSDAGGGIPQNNKGCIFIAEFHSLTGVTPTHIQIGTNTYTGGTASLPTVNLVSSPSINGLTFSGSAIGNVLSANTISGGTLYSGSTDLYSIFLTTNDGNDITRVQPGSNVTTGGTGNLPIINLVSSPSINGLTFSGSAIGNEFSANTISGGTILSGSTDLYSIFLTTNDGNDITRVQPGSNISTGGTGNSPIVNLVSSPSINGLTFSGSAIGNTFSANTISGGTVYSGSTNLYDIFSPIGVGGSSIYVQPGINTYTGGTATLPTINVSALTINTINASGSSTFTGGFSANTVSGGTLYSGDTNLYSIFSPIGVGGSSTYVQPGTNITTGGTATSPIINVTSSPSFNQLSLSGQLTTTDGITATTLSANTIYSGSTNVQTYFNTINAQLATKANLSGATFTGTVNAPALSATTLSGGTIFSGSTNLQNTFNTLNSQLATKANLSGATFTGTVNAPTLSATTLSANTSVFVSSIKFPVSPVSGYVLTSDASGNATWAASPTSGSGTTKLDMQSVSNVVTTPTATASLVDVAGMTLTTKNLGSSATTYYVNFTGDFSNSNNAGNSTFRIVRNGNPVTGGLTNLTNAGASLATANRTVSISINITGVTNGDVIKVQMSASTGTLTARNKTLNIIGILNNNLV